MRALVPELHLVTMMQLQSTWQSRRCVFRCLCTLPLPPTRVWCGYRAYMVSVVVHLHVMSALDRMMHTPQENLMSWKCHSFAPLKAHTHRSYSLPVLWAHPGASLVYFLMSLCAIWDTICL